MRTNTAWDGESPRARAEAMTTALANAASLGSGRGAAIALEKARHFMSIAALSHGSVRRTSRQKRVREFSCLITAFFGANVRTALASTRHNGGGGVARNEWSDPLISHRSCDARAQLAAPPHQSHTQYSVSTSPFDSNAE
jgi:hypothetical protein